ncbi:MAG TPA: TGS domain-containing protein [Firmicutes bacterium]|nr:TGS domain-containing protein [Candidatus Fermentithermobacillaceae bacterium]
MPMPHAEMKRLIQRRLKGTDGAERLRVARECLALLPGYKQGPYADLRKWLLAEMDAMRKRRDARHSGGVFIPRDGDARVVLLGPPNAGKSSLLRSLCGSRVEVGDYAFTTQRPIAATLLLNDARIQLVEIPGLIEGAREDRGSGRMYLGAAQEADGYILVLPLEWPEAGTNGLKDRLERFLAEAKELFAARRHIVAATKADLPGAEALLRDVCACLPGRRVVPVSTTIGQGLQDLKAAIWDMTGLMRVYSKQSTEDRPFIVPRGLTVQGLAEHIHKELGRELEKAAVWGPSAKFPGQVVGRNHGLQDGDTVRLFKKA